MLHVARSNLSQEHERIVKGTNSDQKHPAEKKPEDHCLYLKGGRSSAVNRKGCNEKSEGTKGQRGIRHPMRPRI